MTYTAQTAQAETVHAQPVKQWIPSKWIAGLLGIFFGSMGIHQMYIGEVKLGIAWFIASMIFWNVPPIMGLIGLIGLFQGLSYLFYAPDNWRQRFTKTV